MRCKVRAITCVSRFIGLPRLAGTKIYGIENINLYAQRIAFYPSKLGGNQAAESVPRCLAGDKTCWAKPRSSTQARLWGFERTEKHKVWRLAADAMVSR
jgi:hypothetical protein